MFLHGLESDVDAHGIPVGRKARFLKERFDARLVALDTSAAQAAARRAVERTGSWTYPFEGYDDAFRVPLARARAALSPETRVVVGSSFGGAVLLRLLHEAPVYRGAAVFLAGAGPKLTPYRALPPDVRCLLVHGLGDASVPLEDSEALAETSPLATLRRVDDGHRLGGVVDDDQLGAWIRALLRGDDA